MSEYTTTAGGICDRAGRLVDGDRGDTHGNVLLTHAAIANLWNGYLDCRPSGPLAAKDVALMMVLLKVARTFGGKENLDNYVDIAGYAGCAGEIAARLAAGERA